MAELASLDEFTAYRWAKVGTVECPLCVEQELDFRMLLGMVRLESGKFLFCPVHGPVFLVEAA